MRAMCVESWRWASENGEAVVHRCPSRIALTNRAVPRMSCPWHQ